MPCFRGNDRNLNARIFERNLVSDPIKFSNLLIVLTTTMKTTKNVNLDVTFVLISTGSHLVIN